MLKSWVRWGSALIPTLTSASVTAYLITFGNWQQWGIEESLSASPSPASTWTLKELAPTTSLPTSFPDLANITFTADCISGGRGIEACDPYGRPFQPYVVLPARILAALSLGVDSTGTIGMLLASLTVVLISLLAFLMAALWKRGSLSLAATQLALTLGAVSPAVVLGLQRGQIESLMALLVVASLLTLSRSTALRWLGVPCSFLATAAKYFTVGMFLAFTNRETLRNRNYAVLIAVLASGGLLLLSVSDLRQAASTSRSGTPQTTMSAFGLGNTLATPLSGSTLTCCPPAAVANAWPTIRLTGFAFMLAAITVTYFLIRRIPLPSASSIEWTLTVGSGGVLLIPYLLGSSHDYRLVFLLPLIAGASLWWNSRSSPGGERLSILFVAAGLLALVTSAAMLPTPQGWRWPVWIVVLGDLGLFGILTLTAALALSMALQRGQHTRINRQA